MDFLEDFKRRQRVVRRFLVRAVSLCVCGIVVAIALAASDAAAQLLVVLSDDAAVYQDVAGELKSRLAKSRDGRLRIDVGMAAGLSAFDERRYGAYELIVTIGLAAAQAVISPQNASMNLPPTLCLLMPRQSYDGLARLSTNVPGRRLSAVFVEQPIARQLDLVSLAFPAKSRVGVVFGPTSVALADEVQDNARKRGLALKRIDVVDASGIYSALQTILADSDLLLALPDPVALNASTARSVLLTSYQSQIPVVGFSQAFVDAGALLAVYSTARQHARQGAEIADRALRGETLPPPQYPRYFTVGVNFIAAQSLGLRIDDEATLATGLAERNRDSTERRNSSTSEGAAAPSRKAP